MIATQETTTLTVPAPAKINLYFNIIGRRSDGYHIVDSLIAFTRLGDTLTVRAGNPLDIVGEGPFSADLPPAPQNLVYRAAETLAAAAGVPAFAHISIEKNLPIAAGIGGGSSDAAAAMKALTNLWNLEQENFDLAEIGLSLGADLPVCLRAQTTYAGGIGEILEAGPVLPQAGVVLVNPGIALATPTVFAARKGPFTLENRFSHAPENVAELGKMLAERGNDLTEPAISLCPEIQTILNALEATPGCRLARMSGSGATCFALYDDTTKAEAAADQVARDGWWVAATELIT